MDLNKQKTNQEQTAGDHSVQNQVVGQQINTTNNYIVNGIPITDIVAFTSTVSSQVTQQALAQCTQVAHDVAFNKMSEFSRVWIPRVEKMENTLENLMDPKFQFMIRDANITAAKSSRKEDLDILSELLACHIEKGKDIKKSAGINHAIQIVNEVDLDTLCALTIVSAIEKITITSGDINVGLKVLNDLYSKLLETGLPENDDWIDNALIVNAITMRAGKFFTFKKIMSNCLDGYVCAGIKNNSEKYEKAKEILISNKFNSNALVENILLPGYSRLNIAVLDKLKPELKPILDLYSKDNSLIDQASDNFMKIWDSYEVLNKIKTWFEKLKICFNISSVGLALAQTNAKRVYPNFPDII